MPPVAFRIKPKLLAKALSPPAVPMAGAKCLPPLSLALTQCTMLVPPQKTLSLLFPVPRRLFPGAETWLAPLFLPRSHPVIVWGLIVCLPQLEGRLCKSGDHTSLPAVSAVPRTGSIPQLFVSWADEQPAQALFAFRNIPSLF